MPVSFDRTVCLSGRRRNYGVVLDAQAYRWQTASPDDDLDYYADATELMADVSDRIVSAELSIKPSGAGELTAGLFGVSGTLIVAWLSGGVSGRDYWVKIGAATLGGRTFTRIVNLLIDPRGAATPLPAPPVNDFGAPITWSLGSGPSLNFSVASNSMYSLLIPGF